MFLLCASQSTEHNAIMCFYYLYYFNISTNFLNLSSLFFFSFRYLLRDHTCSLYSKCIIHYFSKIYSVYRYLYSMTDCVWHSVLFVCVYLWLMRLCHNSLSVREFVIIGLTIWGRLFQSTIISEYCFELSVVMTSYVSQIFFWISQMIWCLAGGFTKYLEYFFL